MLNPPTPGAGDPKPLQGHERVRGKEDRCADEVGRAGWSVCVWVGGWGVGGAIV